MTVETAETEAQATITQAGSRTSGGTPRESNVGKNVSDEGGRSTGDSMLVAAESSTALISTPLNLYRRIEGLLEQARGLHLEDGVHSQFSRDLINLVQKSGVSAVEIIAALVVHEKVNSSIAAESLFWLARIQQGRTYKFRLWLLETCLQSPSAQIRDAAALGLVTMGDQHSLEPIKMAAEREECEELKSDLQKAIEQLEHQCRLF